MARWAEADGAGVGTGDEVGAGVEVGAGAEAAVAEIVDIPALEVPMDSRCNPLGYYHEHGENRVSEVEDSRHQVPRRASSEGPWMK